MRCAPTVVRSQVRCGAPHARLGPSCTWPHPFAARLPRFFPQRGPAARTFAGASSDETSLILSARPSPRDRLQLVIVHISDRRTCSVFAGHDFQRQEEYRDAGQTERLEEAASCRVGGPS